MPSAGNRHKATQSDVARLAEVSQATVSYVLSNSTAVTVTEETRERVIAAVAQLGYVPNRVARSLRTNQSHTIAAIIPDITNPFYPAFARGIQDVAEHAGYDVFVYNTDGVEAKERKALRSVHQGGVDGVVMTPFYATPNDAAPILAIGTSLVILGNTESMWADHGVDNLLVDNEGGAREAVNYLIDRGHTRIGMIAGIAGTPPREGRVLGYRNALQEHLISLDNILIRAGDFTEAGGYEAMQELLKLSPRPTALFAANDLMALGALIALREAGIDVPNGMAVVGFDDIPLAALINPPLTTVAQFPGELGRRAAEMLFERIRGQAGVEGRVELAPTKLIVRSSA